jgi:hypothetical protein
MCITLHGQVEENWDLMNKQVQNDSCGMDKTGHQGCSADCHKTLNIEKDQKITGSFFSVSQYYL